MGRKMSDEHEVPEFQQNPAVKHGPCEDCKPPKALVAYSIGVGALIGLAVAWVVVQRG